MTSIAAQIADLPGWQRARIDWIRVSWAPDRGPGVHPRTPPGWAVVIEWMGMMEVTGPSARLDTALPEGVFHASWAKPGPITLTRPDGAAIEDELADLAASRLLGDMVVDRVTDPTSSRLRWQAQPWIGCTLRSALINGPAAYQQLLVAQADVALARWRLTQADTHLINATREAMRDGLGATAAAAALGVSRARIYQLRDGRR